MKNKRRDDKVKGGPAFLEKLWMTLGLLLFRLEVYPIKYRTVPALPPAKIVETEQDLANPRGLETFSASGLCQS
jgi:hypothetical protein